MLLVISWQSVWPLWERMLLLYPNTDSCCQQSLSPTWSPRYCNLNAPCPPRHLFETETDGWGADEVSGVLQLLTAFFWMGRGMKQWRDRSFWNSWEGTHTWPDSLLAQRRLHCKSGLRKGQAPKGPWTVSPSRAESMACLLKSTLSLCFYFPNHDRKAFRYPHPTPQKCLQANDSRIASKNNQKQKNQLYHSKDYCHFILQLSVIG